MPQATRIEIFTGDITTLKVQAIVNAANESLLGGGGVDGAIHRAAGPALLAHNRTLGGCPTGLAKLTPSFNLANQGVRYLIHAVGPVWNHPPGHDTAKLGYEREDVLLASCYTTALALATEHQCASLAFPCISTGVYRFPRARAAKIALGHILHHLTRHDTPAKVIICCFAQDDADLYQELLGSRQQWLAARST